MGIDLCMNKRGPAPEPVDLTWLLLYTYNIHTIYNMYMYMYILMTVLLYYYMYIL